MKNSKPRFIAYVAMSLDGIISQTKKSMPTWTSPEDWKFFQSELAKLDAVIVGRNTYEAAKPRLQKRNTFVFTHRAKQPRKIGSVTFLNPDITDLPNIFKPFRTIGVLGGTSVYTHIVNNHLLDELFITIEPIILGRGKRMFEPDIYPAQIHLLSSKKLNKRGTYLLHYKINKLAKP